MKRKCDRCKRKNIYNDPYSAYCNFCLDIMEAEYERKRRMENAKG